MILIKQDLTKSLVVEETTRIVLENKFLTYQVLNNLGLFLVLGKSQRTQLNWLADRYSANLIFPEDLSLYEAVRENYSTFCPEIHYQDGRLTSIPNIPTKYVLRRISVIHIIHKVKPKVIHKLSTEKVDSIMRNPCNACYNKDYQNLVIQYKNFCAEN